LNDLYEIIGERQGVDTRDKVMHIEKNSQSFAAKMMLVHEQEQV